MSITQQDIADRVGTTRRTVSYALNGGGNVSAEMKQRILALAAEMGYQPNRAAQTLVTGRTNQIAFCVPSLDSPFHTQFVRYFEAFARSTSYDLLVTTTQDRKQPLSQLAVDGILWHHSTALPTREITCPAVVLQSPPSLIRQSERVFDQVWLGLTEASVGAMRHLLCQDAKRVAFVTFAGMLMEEDPRYAAYLKALDAANMEPEIIVLGFEGHADVRPLTHQVLNSYFTRNGIPEALFCCNDEVAIGAYRALRTHGRQVPAQTMVIGCDDIPEIEDIYPPLTSIRHSWEDICRNAWEMLISRIQNPTMPKREATFEGQLVIRESTTRRHTRHKELA